MSVDECGSCSNNSDTSSGTSSDASSGTSSDASSGTSSEVPYDNNQPSSASQTTISTTTEEDNFVSTTTTTATIVSSEANVTPACTPTSAPPIPSPLSTEMGVIAPASLGPSRGTPLSPNTQQGASHTPPLRIHIVPEATSDPRTSLGDTRTTLIDPLVRYRAGNSGQSHESLPQDNDTMPQDQDTMPQDQDTMPLVTTTQARSERDRLAALNRRLVRGKAVKRKLWEVDHARVKVELEEELGRVEEEEEIRFRARWLEVGADPNPTGPAFYCSQVITAEGKEELPASSLPPPGDIKFTHAMAKRRRTQPPFPPAANFVISKGSERPSVASQDFKKALGVPQVTSNLLSHMESQQQTSTPPAEAAVRKYHASNSENGNSLVTKTTPASSSSSSESPASSNSCDISAISTRTPVPEGERLSLPSTPATSSVATVDFADPLSPNVSASSKSSSGVSSANSTPTEETSTPTEETSTPTEETSTPSSGLVTRRAPQETLRPQKRPRLTGTSKRYLRM